MPRDKGIRGGMTNAGDVQPRTQRGKASGSVDVAFAGWANYTMGAEEKQPFEAWLQTDAFSLDTDALVENGLKLSVGLDKDNRTYVASAFDRSLVSGNAGMMTSQRSSSALRALAKLVYCVRYLMGEDWERWTQVERDNW